jgi:AraC family transcriptional regulator, regulatory protein of adaptative response / DNA-3-methyladenine glycosylase II
MALDGDVCYRALSARDSRFDGVFFVGVKSTGIYCRPVCTAKTPGRRRCCFFENAALAERAGFRPCLRCRPELAPGFAPVDQARSVARAAAVRIQAGALSDGNGLEELASSLGLSSRQLRRSVRKELGVSPVELAQTNRLLLAKRLITETRLPMTRIAFASGFDSVRRFNSLFRSHYRLTPGAMRRLSPEAANDDTLRLVLAYRPPFNWESLIQFLAARAIPGVECVIDDRYLRTVAIGEHRGWLSVSPVAGRHQLSVQLSTMLTPALPSILARLRSLFDLDCRPDLIASHLQRDARLRPLVKRNPGLRVPGAFDPFELAMRAILGQQVSVRGASTLAGRVADRFGESIQTPFAELNRIVPTAAGVADASVQQLASIGLPKARAESLRNLAAVVARGEIDLDPGADVVETVSKLRDLPGIGPWTADYIAMRALHWPDAFPHGDLGLMKAMNAKSARVLETEAENWRPWRAYAAMHLWQSLKARVQE